MWIPNIPHSCTPESAGLWIARITAAASTRACAIEFSGQLAGCVSCWPHEADGVEVGYWVGRGFRGKRVGTTALRLFIEHYGPSDTSKIFAKVMSGNIASQRVLEKCGFSFLKRATVVRGGREIETRFYRLERPV